MAVHPGFVAFAVSSPDMLPEPLASAVQNARETAADARARARGVPDSAIRDELAAWIARVSDERQSSGWPAGLVEMLASISLACVDGILSGLNAPEMLTADSN